MKTKIAYSLVIACCATLFASCEGNELKVSVAGNDGVKVTINAAAETRTYIGTNGDGDKCSYWNKGDILGVWAGSVDAAPSAFTNGSADGEAASFTGTVPEFSGSTTLYALFPQARIVNPTTTHSAAQVNFPGTQAPVSSASYDPKAEVLVAMPEVVEAGEDGSIVSEMKFARLNSAIKVNLIGELPAGVGAGEKINKLIFAVGSECNLETGEGIFVAGNVDLSEECAMTDEWTAASNYVTVAPTAAFEFDDPIYFTVAPCIIPTDTTLYFRLYTDEHIIVKEVKLSSVIDLSSGSFATFNVSLADVTVTGLPAVKSVSSAGVTSCVKQPDNTYTVTIEGSYEAENISQFDKVTYFFYYKVNNGKQTTSTLLYSYNDSETYSFEITGLEKNQTVDYITVARVGASGTNNVKTAWLSQLSAAYVVDPDAPLIDWESEARYAWAFTASASPADKFDATTGDGAYLITSLPSGSKVLRSSTSGLQLLPMDTGDEAYFVLPSTGYQNGQRIRASFANAFYATATSGYPVVEDGEISFEIYYKRGDYSDPEGYTLLPEDPAFTTAKKAYEYVFSCASGSGDIVFKVKNTDVKVQKFIFGTNTRFTFEKLSE